MRILSRELSKIAQSGHNGYYNSIAKTIIVIAHLLKLTALLPTMAELISQLLKSICSQIKKSTPWTNWKALWLVKTDENTCLPTSNENALFKHIVPMLLKHLCMISTPGQSYSQIKNWNHFWQAMALGEWSSDAVTSDTRLGDFLKLFVSNSLTKVTRTFFDFYGYLEKVISK